MNEGIVVSLTKNGAKVIFGRSYRTAQSLVIRCTAVPNIQNQELLAWLGSVDAVLITDAKVLPGLESPITEHIIPLYSLESIGPYWESKTIPNAGKLQKQGLESLLKAAVYHAENRGPVKIPRGSHPGLAGGFDPAVKQGAGKILWH